MTTEKNSTTGVGTDGVPCPVCDEPDMRRESNGEGDSLVFCVNYGCASNGGLMHNAITVSPSPAEVPVGYEIVKSSFLISAKEVVLSAAKLLVAQEEVKRSEAAFNDASSNVSTFFAAGEKLKAKESFDELVPQLRAKLFEYRQRQDTSTIPSTSPLAAALSPEQVKLDGLVRGFIQRCARLNGKMVSGDDLSASALRLLEQLDAAKGQK